MVGLDPARERALTSRRGNSGGSVMANLFCQTKMGWLHMPKLLEALTRSTQMTGRGRRDFDAYLETEGLFRNVKEPPSGPPRSSHPHSG